VHRAFRTFPRKQSAVDVPYDRFICEVDIVLPEDMPLKQTHDIGEALEIKIENLDVVERAFVHIDYEWEHQAEHKRIEN